MKKVNVDLEAYYDFESVFPVDYFEVKIGSESQGTWHLFFVDEKGKESEFGPFSEQQLLERIELAPFLVEPLVFVYYLIESKDQEVHDLGVRLLKLAARL